MVNAKQVFTFVTDDREMERIAWQTALIMNSSGNYKKQIDPTKLYKRHYDDYGNEVVTGHGAFTPIDPADKEARIKALLEKFNR